MPAPVKTPQKPKIVNRGPAGLLHKKPKTEGEAPSPQPAPEQVEVKKNWIRCPGEVVDIATLIPDPRNARLHPERNHESIKGSLAAYGQMKCIVVRKDDRVVVAGNGTMEAAIALGWTKIACNMVEDLTEVDALAYGLADNRSAEFAKWDIETVAQLDKLIQELDPGHPMVGWSQDELEVLRTADWSPPPVDDTASDGTNGQQTADSHFAITFTLEQMAIINKAIQLARDNALAENRESPDAPGTLVRIVEEWLVAEGAL